MNVFDEEYWLTCYDFPNYRISSFGRIWDIALDEEVMRTRSRGEIRARLNYQYSSFVGPVWTMMYATFWRGGWGIHVDIYYRDEDPSNLSMFNLMFETDGKPLLYRIDETTGLWHRKRGGQPRRVMIVETGEEFKSVAEMVAAHHMERNAVYMCLRGSQGSHHGFTFQYLD